MKIDRPSHPSLPTVPTTQPLNIHLNKRNHCLYSTFCPHFSVIYNLKYYEMINVYKFNAQNCVRCFGDTGISTSAPRTEETGG